MSMPLEPQAVPPQDTTPQATEPQTDPQAAAPQPTAPPRRRLAIVLAALLLILGALGGWAYYSTRPYPAEVTRRDITANLTLTGTVVAPPSARAEILPPYHAPVDKVRASVGSHVRRGDVLVQLAMPSQQSAYAQARDNVNAAEEAYANASRQYDDAIQAARKQLADARKAAAAAHQAATTPAPSPDSDTGETTPANQTTPDTDTSQVDADMQTAQEALKQAVADREAGLITYRQQREAARESLWRAHAGERTGLIRAPIAGTVLALDAQPGQTVGTDTKQPVAILVNLKALQVQATMDAKQAAGVRPGLPATLTFSGVPDKPFPGEVLHLTTTQIPGPVGLGRQPGYVAILAFKNEQEQVQPNMTATVAIKLGAVKDVPAVPSEAVDLDPTGRPIVKTLRNGQWKPVVVQIGLSDGQYTQIKSGLRKGETVQVTPKLHLP